MAIKAIIDSLDEVDEKYRDLYVEKNGKFEAQIDGARSQADIDRLSSALKKERDDHKATREKYSFLSDLEPAKVQEMLDKYPELEAAATGKIDEVKLNQLLEGRLNSHTAPLKRELDKLRKESQDKDGLIDGYKTRDKQRAISDAVRQAAAKLKVQESAIEDAILLGDRHFEMSEDGTIVTRDGVGVTPGVSAEVWLTDMQSKRPHWWGPSVGGGAGGQRGSLGGGSNPWSAESWNMTQQGQILRENRSKAEQLAKAAGTTIGGPKPASK